MPRTGAAEGVQDWADHLERTSIWQLLVRLELWKYKAVTINDKNFGPTKVDVVGQTLPALTHGADHAYLVGAYYIPWELIECLRETHIRFVLNAQY